MYQVWVYGSMSVWQYESIKYECMEYEHMTIWVYEIINL